MMTDVDGFVYDCDTPRFRENQINLLYRHIPTKKDLPVPEKSFLVAGGGLEPPTFWL